MYWHTGFEDAPDIVKASLRSWREQNTEWDVVSLCEETLSSVIDLKNECSVNTQNLTLAAFSDVLRINLLAKYGGVWVDATTICKKGLDFWLPPLLKSEFFAFHKPGQDREMASWFIAAQPNCNLIQEWKLFLDAHLNKPNLKMGNAPQYFGQESEWLFSNYWFNREELPYFWLHYSFAYLLKVNKIVQVCWDKTPKYTADLPHFYATNGYKPMLRKIMQREWRHGISPLYKMTYRKSPLNIQGMRCPVDFISGKILNSTSPI